MEKKEIIMISLIMFLCLFTIAIGVIIYINKTNEEDKDTELAEIQQIQTKIEQININSKENDRIESNDDDNKDITVSMPYFKNNVNPISNIDGYTKLSTNQTKIGGGYTVLWYPSSWKVSGGISGPEIRVKNVFFEMELNSEATYDQFIDKAINTIKNNSSSYWSYSEEDHDNEYSVEEFEVNGYEYKLIKVISTSKYTPHGKTYTYFFPLQKNNMLYALMAYVSEENHTEDNINTIKKIFSTYYIY